MEAFQTKRVDGRSDRVVIVDMVRGAAPDTLFKYEAIKTALQAGLGDDDAIDRHRIYSAIGTANKTLLKEERRFLRVERGKGYRVCRAEEHAIIATGYGGKAEDYIKRGIEILTHTRTDELSEAQRHDRQGMLNVMAGLWLAHKTTESRLDRIEKVVKTLVAAKLMPEVNIIESNAT